MPTASEVLPPLPGETHEEYLERMRREAKLALMSREGLVEVDGALYVRADALGRSAEDQHNRRRR